MAGWKIRIIETADEIEATEALQGLVWSGSETEIVPAHMLLAVVHNGGVLLGAFLNQAGPDQTGLDEPVRDDQSLDKQGLDDSRWDYHGPSGELIGLVFGFPGIYPTPDGPRVKHHSHILAVHPDHRNLGIGFGLKRAQWQIVRHQGIDLITWTYDPLLSRNAHLNITRLGAVCNQYRRNEYGEMRDDLNAGLPTDRFQVNWWVNTKRVERRLSRHPRLKLDLAHFLSGGAQIVNPTSTGPDGWPRPHHGAPTGLTDSARVVLSGLPSGEAAEEPPAAVEKRNDALLLVEIPADFQALRAADQALAMEWRLHTRELFEEYFLRGYLVTDFIYLPGNPARSFYVLSHGESTL